jgi:hypothetical protein
MPNTFHTASTTIRALKRDLGIEAIPAYHIGSKPGVFVANGLLCIFGPIITVRSGDGHEANSVIAAQLRVNLQVHGWSVKPAEHALDATIRVNSIPRKR